MGRFLLRRLLLAIITLLIILYLAALGLEMAYWQRFSSMLASGWKTSWLAFTRYLRALVQGDLGMSFSRQQEPVSVSWVIPRTLGKSLLLLGVALLMAAVLGILLGGAAARRRRSPFTFPILLSSLLGTSVPSFLLALALQVAAIRFYQKTGLRLVSMGGFKESSLWIPALVLAARPLAQITRVTFFSISEALEQDYVRTALGKGVPRRALFRRHIYRNVAIPIFTTLVTSIRFALVSLPVVEYYFGWPGAGEALLRGIRSQDGNLVFGLLLCLGLLFILANALLELLYLAVDPRLRAGASWEKRFALPMRQGLGAALGEVGQSILDSGPIFFLRRLLRRRRAESSAFAQVLHQRALEQGGEELGSLHRRERRRAWLRGTLLNPTLLLGLAILIPLLGLVLFGSELAPHNPYNTISIRFVEGRIQTPPFRPSAEFPLGSDAIGRDVWSLLLVGAQQTLVIASIAVVARLALGSILGLLSGWFEGSWLDRAITNLIEIIAAFPTLLFAMVVILALGIRRGISTFIVALCFVGWGEVAQFVRAQVATLKPRPFVEAAVVTGGRWPEILTRHILPNLLSPLVALASLEMGAVLMLWGELGFVGIFIGGGAYVDVNAFQQPYFFSDIPEWAALLANVRRCARSYPWMAWPPAIAFAITILAFNLTGEGLLRLIDRMGASFTRLLNRYTALAAAAFIGLIFLVRAQTAPMAYYRLLATSFDGEQALQHVRRLTAEKLEGRLPGTEGADWAAQYIAARFKEAGLQPAGRAGTYFQEVDREYVMLAVSPTLVLLQPNQTAADPQVWPHSGVAPPDRKLPPAGAPLQEWAWLQDFNVAPYPYWVYGEGEGEVVFVGLGPASSSESPPGLSGLEELQLQGRIALVPDRRSYEALAAVHTPIAGALVIADDPDALGRLALGSPGVPPSPWNPAPALIVHARVAERLLEGSGIGLPALQKQVADLEARGVLIRPLGKRVAFQAPGTMRQVRVRNVLALLPGGSGTGGASGGQDQKMDDQLVILMAPYDGLGRRVGQALLPGAQDNAAGVATLIEIARAWKEASYRPKRTVLFVAYAGQGVTPGGASEVLPGLGSFLQARHGFLEALTIWAVVDLRGLGGSDGRAMLVGSPDAGLSALLSRAGRRFQVKVRRQEVAEELGRLGEGGRFNPFVGVEGEIRWVEIHWEGWDEVRGTVKDRPERVSAEALERAGRAASLAAMVLGREWQY